MLGTSRPMSSSGRARGLRGMFLWGAALLAIAPLVADCGGGGDDGTRPSAG